MLISISFIINREKLENAITFEIISLEIFFCVYTHVFHPVEFE